MLKPMFCFFFFKRLQFKNRRDDRERKGSIPFHHTGKKRQRRMGVPFLMHEDHLDVSPTRSTFSFGSFSGLGDDRRALERSGCPSTIMGNTSISVIIDQKTFLFDCCKCCVVGGDVFLCSNRYYIQ